MISPALIDFLRGVSEAFLPDTATIQRYTETNTADGVTWTWSVVGTADCRVSPAAGSMATERAGTEQGVMRAISEWTVWTPWNTDVTVKDRVVVEATDRVDGRVFEVNRVGERSYASVLELVCTLVT